MERIVNRNGGKTWYYEGYNSYATNNLRPAHVNGFSTLKN